MNIQLFREIIGYTQNLGSHEDIVTACLATAFSYCPKFTRKFFLELDINDFPWRHERGHDYGYLVSTGPRINGNFGKLGSGIDFKPDIMISKLEEWEDKSKLKNEHLILIESKLGAVLDEKQEKNYQLFRKRFSKKFPNQIHLILISLKKESFDNFLNKSWYEIIEIIEKIIKDMDDWSSEKLILKEIFDFMRISLIPDKGNFKNDEMDYCPKRILNELKSRTNFSSARLKQYSSISKNPISCPEYQAMKKDYGLASSSPMSFIDIPDNSIESYLCCVISKENDIAIFWTEYFEEVQRSNFLGSIHLNSSSWIDEWFAILSKICSPL